MEEERGWLLSDFVLSAAAVHCTDWVLVELCDSLVPDFRIILLFVLIYTSSIISPSEEKGFRIFFLFRRGSTLVLLFISRVRI